jgi:hypothetical protein
MIGLIEKLRPFCAQKYLKLSKKIEKNRGGSKAENPDKSFSSQGFALFFRLALLPVSPTHGRSHRFKSCIAHSPSTFIVPIQFP